jgi:hypothetical protein
VTRIRRVGAIALVAPLAAGLAVLGPATPAFAIAGTVDTPADGAVFTSGSSVTATGTFTGADMELRASTPNSGDILLDKGSLAGEFSGTIPLSVNGSYKVYIKGAITETVYDTNTFTVKIPPATPSGLSAKASGNKISVSWNRGSESDLSGYTVTAGKAGSKSGSDDSLCSGSNCSTTLSLPSGTSGSVPITVRAKRSDGLGGSLSSGSASTSVSVAPPAASGGAGTGGLGSLPPGAPGVAPTTGGAPLTPFNGESPVSLPSVQPEGAQVGLTYPTPQVVGQSAAPKATNVAAAESMQWSTSVGIALVLLVAAAHLGTWTRRMRLAQAGLSSKGRAARMARGGSGRTRVRRAREHIARAEAVAKTSELAGILGARRPAGGTRKLPAGRGTGPADSVARMASQPSRAASRRPAQSAKRVPGGSGRPASSKRHADTK